MNRLCSIIQKPHGFLKKKKVDFSGGNLLHAVTPLTINLPPIYGPLKFQAIQLSQACN